MPHTSDRLHGCRVSDEWTFRGMRMAVLENDHLRVVIALDRGAEILEFRTKSDDLDPLLHLPGGPRDPRATLPSIGSAGGTFLDYYAGGWQEIVPNGGPAGSHRGVEYGQHGEVSLVPWTFEVLEDDADRVAVRCSVRGLRTPFLLERRMTLRADRAALYLDERITNEAGEDLDVMWGHHVAFGRPMLDPGARIWTSARTVIAEDAMDGFEPRRVRPGHSGPWPIAPAPDGGDVDLRLVPSGTTAAGREMCYLTDLGDAAWYAIASSQRGFAMRWDGGVFKYLWLWQELGEAAGYPWWGRIRTVALEPWTSYPTLGLAEAVRRGTQLVVPAGGTVETSLVAVSFRPAGDVTGVGADGSVTFGDGTAGR